jgi:hypothetical protein
MARSQRHLREVQHVDSAGFDATWNGWEEGKRGQGEAIVLPELPTPVLLEAFDVDNFTLVGANAAKALDTSNKVEGTGSMSVTGHTLNQTSGLDKTYGSLDPTGLGTLVFHHMRVNNSLASLSVALHRGAITSNVTHTEGTVSFRGGRWIATHINEWPTVRDAGVGTLRVRELMAPTSPFSAQSRFDALYYNAKGRPTVVLTFDDVRTETYDTAFPLMQARGLKGTCYVPSAEVGATDKMTLAELQELYAAGWDMACDSTDDSPFTGMASTAAALTDVQTVRTYLETNSMPRAKNHFCWPNGTWSEAIAAAFEGDGFLSARTTVTQSFYDRFGLGGIAMTVPSQGSGSAVASSVHTARLTEALLRGTTQFFHFHDIKDSPSAGGWQTSKFVTFLDEIETARDAGELVVMTVSEWYARASVATL